MNSYRGGLTDGRTDRYRSFYRTLCLQRQIKDKLLQIKINQIRGRTNMF